MSVQRIDRLSWSRSGRPVAKSDRRQVLNLIRSLKKRGYSVEEIEPLARQAAERTGKPTTVKKKARPVLAER